MNKKQSTITGFACHSCPHRKINEATGQPTCPSMLALSGFCPVVSLTVQKPKPHSSAGDFDYYYCENPDMSGFFWTPVN